MQMEKGKVENRVKGVRRWLAGFFFATGPAVLLSIVVIILFFAVVFVRYRGKIIFTDATITFPSFALIFLIGSTVLWNIRTLVSEKEKRREVLLKIKDVFLSWLPLPLLLFVYENLKGRIHILTNKDFTYFFMKIDELIYGVQPSVFLERFLNPFLTDLMAFFYASYFAIPFLCAFLLYVKGREEEFHMATTSLIICFYLGFIGYISFPAGPPRFYLHYNFPLEGHFHEFMHGLYTKANPAEKFGAFPSLHVGGSTLGLILSYHFKGMWGNGRRLFWTFLPIVIGLWISTVYLRHHWTLDIFAGWVVAIISFYAGIWLVKKWSSMRVNLLQRFKEG